MTSIHEYDETAVRRAYIAGLRKLADLLEGNVELSTPDTGNIRGSAGNSIINIYGGSRVRQLANAELMAKLLGRPVKADVRNSNGRMVAWLTWHIEGVTVRMPVDADRVAEKCVTETYKVGDRVHEKTGWVLAERFQPATEPAPAEGGADDA